MPSTKILVVDDDADEAEMLAEVLNAHLFEARSVSKVAEALTTIEAWRPDVLLLDVQMSDVSGPQFADTLTHVPEWAQSRLVFMTGSAIVPADLPRHHGFLRKPFTAEEMLSTLRTLNIP